MADYGQARVLDEAEMKRLRIIGGDSRYGLRNASIIDFSFLCGLRSKEIAGLRIKDVVDSSGHIKNKFHLDKEITKGVVGKKKGRTVFLSNKGLRMRLQAYLDTRGIRGVATNEMLFKTQKGGFTSQSVQNLFRKIYVDAGFDDCSSHSGRRTFCTNLIMKGYDIKSVSTLMGHSNINMTSKYIQTNPNVLSMMVAGLN